MIKINFVLLIFLSLILIFPAHSQKVGAKAGEIKTITVKEISFNMVWCPPGTFTMGSPVSLKERDNDEIEHKVTLTKGFWMMESEVFQKLYETIMGNNPSVFKGQKLPVENISWFAAVEFSKKLSELTGKNFSLPTEAEWEYACRAGTTTPFHYGDSFESTMANFNGSYPYGTGVKGINRGKTTDIKSFKPNAWGLYDMHGNVWEWCLDWYGEYKGDATDPKGPETGLYRVFRGGGWRNYGSYCLSANRSRYYPVCETNYIGFRLVIR